jgi:hypothetical protein
MSPKEQKQDALMTVGSLALAPVESATKDSAEDLALNPEFDQSEIRLPQLKVCQSMTPQRKRSDPSYIEGLQEGDLFNDASGQNYGQGPLKFVMLKYWVNYIKFNPLEQGGGIACRGTLGRDGIVRDEAGNVLRTGFGPKGEKPEVQKLMNYLLYLPDTQEIVWFSAKSTSIKVMRQFHTALRGVSGIADFRKVFTLSTASTKNTAGQEFSVPVIPKRPIGIVPAEAPLTAHLKQLAHDLATKVVDTSAVESADEQAIDGDEVPF